MKLGRHHPTLKRLRGLRRSPQERVRQGLLVAEGAHLAREAIAAGCDLETAVFDARLTTSEEGVEILARLRELGVPCHEVTESVMRGLQDARSPQPVLLEIGTARLNERPWRRRGEPLVVVCDGVQDPGNLGAIVRSVDAAGASVLIATGQTADWRHPRTVRGSMGSIFRLPIESAELGTAIERLRKQGLTLVGTSVRGGEDFRDAALTGACALIFGGEGAGLGEDFLRTLDRVVTIPLHSGVESLSVGAAVAVTLFEVVRPRRV
jgi:TrmH family RNA methyltransferase